MRALGVELLEEVVEAGLLLQAVHAGRPGCFLLQGEVHALVTAVLLRMARFDALDGDAEAEPPDRQLGEVEERVRAGERNAIIGADGAWQPALAEETLESGHRRLLADGIERLAHEQETGSVVGDGKRVAVAAVAEAELAFEVGAPQIIGLGAV